MRTSHLLRGGALALVLAATPIIASATAGAAELQLWRFFNECAAKYPADVTTIDPNNADVCAVQQILANKFNAENPDLQVKTTSLLWPGIVELNSALSAGTPPDIVMRLNQEITKALNAPALKKRLVNLGIQPWPGSPEEFASLVRSERARFAQLIKAAGIRKR